MKINLNGNWKIKVDSDNSGKKEAWYQSKWLQEQYTSLQKLQVPSNYNIIPELFQYSGIIWYFFKLPDLPKFGSKEDLLLHLDGVNYFCEVWINGNYIGNHEGGFLPFKFILDSKLFSDESHNWISIRVDSYMLKDRIPGESTDWFNWGGIHRNVFLEIFDKVRIEDVKLITNFNSTKPQEANLNINLKIHNLSLLLAKSEEKQQQPFFSFRIEKWKSPNPNHKNSQFKPVIIGSQIISKQEFYSFNVSIDSPQLWSPDSPDLYLITFRINDNLDPIQFRFGIRTIETRGPYLLLNKRPIKMKGVSLHEEQVPFGRHYSIEMRRKELQEMKILGFNALRSAHYSHDEILCTLCDEEGLLLLEEIPVYWNIAFRNRKVMYLAAKMIKDLINRDFNHPSVIIWSVGNEIPVENRDCRQSMTLFIEWAKKLDPTRLIIYASCRMVSDVTRRKCDLNAVNFYFGWYYFSPYNLNFFLDALYYGTNPNSPWIMTEFGGGAKFGVRDINEKFSEDNQARSIAHQIKVMNSKPYIAGWFIWIYRDFRSSQRLNKFQQGFNRKGIVSEINEKKLIARVMPRIVNSTLARIRHYRGLAMFYAHIMRWVELIAVKVLFTLEFRREKKMVDQYYKQKIEVKEF